MEIEIKDEILEQTINRLAEDKCDLRLVKVMVAHFIEVSKGSEKRIAVAAFNDSELNYLFADLFSLLEKDKKK